MKAAPVVSQHARDLGLQGERTALAWIRTALAISVNALLALRGGLTTGEDSITAVGMVLLIAAGACTLCGVWRRRSLLIDPQASAPPAGIILGVALVALLASAAAVASIVVSQAH